MNGNGYTQKQRCPWCLNSALERHYHDTEWGVPVYDGDALFESLSLEGAQAGLSWSCILNKREGYRELYSGFSIEKVARFSEKKIEKLTQNPAIVRHPQKIRSVVHNAQRILELRKGGIDFSEFVWDFVGGSPLKNKWQQLSDIPSQSVESAAMSKALKKQGFKFIGATTCYSFMQASGLVQDHLMTCFRYKDLGAK